jgi:hypothetical protein
MEKVATQKEKRVHNPLPSVTVDATGVHAGMGGGSVDDQSGQSIFQRAWSAVMDTLKGWTWWLVVLGLAALAFFVLPILFPVLAPIFSSVMDGLGRMWTWITGELGRLMTWLKSVHAKTPTVVASTTTVPVSSPLVAATASPVPVSVAPAIPAPAVVATAVSAPAVTEPLTPTQQLQADAAALGQQAQALADKVANG